MTEERIFESAVTDGFDHVNFISHLTERPGIYQMLDRGDTVLYVGKAKNLKKRVASYFRATGLTSKTIALVNRIHSIQVTVTNSETEALLLEQNLIKAHRPHYNIVLRDDKSYPYIHMSSHESPRLSFHRGAKREGGRYFGPFPSAAAVRDSLYLLQKVFQVRQCEDSYFKNRSRPCLQYQIKRCLGPCVGMVEKAEYDEAVRHTTMFLEGKSRELIDELGREMEQASQQLDFEHAAVVRDQIAQLQMIQERQYIEGESGDADVIAASIKAGTACVQVLFVRDGRILGSRSYFPRLQLEENAAEVLSAFVPQFYLLASGREIPREILLATAIEDADAVQQALSSDRGARVSVSSEVRSHRARWLQLAQSTADQNLQQHLADKENVYQRVQQLQEVLQLESMPERIECFDISHSHGEETVASCVVFDQHGPVKRDYRRFNIKGITGGDDYAAMQQALERRFSRLKAEDARMPDVLLIDGGKGQTNRAAEVLQALQINGIKLVGVAKGVTRKAGLETLFMAETQTELTLPPDSPALHLIQYIRDESHRFAITGHRARRNKKRGESVLEQIPGVGAKRRRDLLKQFGGLQGISRASIEALCTVPGINQRIAADIYAAFHNE